MEHIRSEQEKSAIHHEQLPEKERADMRLGKAVKFFGDVLKDKDYVVFASTAMRLNGEKYEEGDGMLRREAPGDLDINFFNEADFYEFVRRMDQLGATFATNEDGEVVRSSTHDGAKMVQGFLNFDAEIPYQFEAFLNSSFVPDRKEYIHDIAGLRVLTVEGLSKQYERNLAMEEQVVGKVRDIKKFLDSDLFKELRNLGSIEVDGDRITLEDVYRDLGVTAKDVEDYFERTRLAEEIFAGYKTKLNKRMMNLQALAFARGHESTRNPRTTS